MPNKRSLHMPAHYAPIDPAEQRAIQGGGPVSDAVVAFLDSLHLTDFYRGSSVLTFSFTFVPALFFTAVRAVFGLGQELAEGPCTSPRQGRPGARLCPKFPRSSPVGPPPRGRAVFLPAGPPRRQTRQNLFGGAGFFCGKQLPGQWAAGAAFFGNFPSTGINNTFHFPAESFIVKM